MNTLAIFAPCTQTQRARVEELCSGWLRPAFYPEECPEEQQLEVLPEAEIVFGEPEPRLLPCAKKLRWMQISWAGADSFLRSPEFPAGVTLTNASGAYGEVIAEHALALLLALARRLPAYLAQQQRAVWGDCGTEWTLNDKHILILGAGDLGGQLARRLQGFGVHITGVCRTARPAQAPFDELIPLSQLDAVLPQADAVFGCLPGTAATAGLLNRRRLEMLKQDAIVINVGRGSLIDLDALVQVLRSGRLFGVGLDVMEQEPLPPEHPLWHMERVILTPHIAGVGFGHLARTEEKIWSIFLENLRRYRAGQNLLNVVNHTQGY